MPADAEVDLGERAEAAEPQQVDEQPDLHAVAGDERHLLQGRAAAGVLAAQRLDEPGQLRPQRVEQRAGGQLGDPAAAGGLHRAVDLERPGVAALHVGDLRVGQQRAEQPGHVVGDVAEQVGVEEDDEVAGGRGQRLPQRLALAGAGAVGGQHVGGGDDVGAGRPGDRGGGVGGVGVDDQQLVDQRQPAHPALVQVGDQAPDGRRLVPRRQDDADPVAAPALGPQQGVEIELRQGGGGRRPVLEPGAGVGSHRLTVDQDRRTGQDGPPKMRPSSRVRHRRDAFRRRPHLADSLRFPGGSPAVGAAESFLHQGGTARHTGEQQGTRGKPAQDRGDHVTIRTDAALTRRVTGARLVTTLAVLGGTLALAGLGVVRRSLRRPRRRELAPAS